LNQQEAILSFSRTGKASEKLSTTFLKVFREFYIVGTYFGTVSLYMFARARVNFGELDFKYPLPTITSTSEKAKPYKQVLKDAHHYHHG
jgi:hypothetical protein